MSAVILDGGLLAKEVEAALGRETGDIASVLGRSPKLAVVLVGSDPASKVYVRSKTKRARQCGIDVEDCHLETTTDEELQQRLRALSGREEIDGILLQLPLPRGLNEFAALQAISPEKDVDGLHAYTQGLLLRSQDGFLPCTPRGCIMLLERAQKALSISSLAGLQAVVVGRSILVGKPMALLLLQKNCTVTVCHSKTRDLAAECRRADILVAAIGRPQMITKDYVKEGAIVIDVGINKTPEGKLVGDVAFEEVWEKTAAITPVPGGVGPMTIAMLLSNTVEAAKKKAMVKQS